ncbi:MAG: HNH endonuclease [Roseovarius sp.]|uniref:HNH endonuclease n=1 Tax=Roseovarius sp. TaxID=1486281 RepID=UPI0032ECE253
MGKLAGRGLTSRLGRPASRLRRSETVSRDQERAASQPWRKWYSTAKWAALKKRVHQRDDWVCQQTGVLLIGKHPAPNSPVADHIEPHRGDPELFWDESNVQTVSKSWHDSEKQRQERRGDA